MQRSSNFFVTGPWWIRLIIFCGLGAPLVNPDYVTSLLSDSHLGKVGCLTVYACLIWLFVGYVAGIQRLFTYLAAAFSLVVSTVVVGGAVRAVVGLSGNSVVDKLKITSHLVDVFFMIIISVPYFSFVIQSFSATSIVENSLKNRSKWSTAKMHLAVSLRVFQHLIEILPNLLIIWREEFPDVILPRSRGNWRGSAWWLRLPQLLDWFAAAFWAWACCLLVNGLKIVPSVEAEAKRLLNVERVVPLENVE